MVGLMILQLVYKDFIKQLAYSAIAVGNWLKYSSLVFHISNLNRISHPANMSNHTGLFSPIDYMLNLWSFAIQLLYISKAANKISEVK